MLTIRLSCEMNDSTETDKVEAATNVNSPETLYLELLKGCLTRTLFGESYLHISPPPGSLRAFVYKPLKKVLDLFDLQIQKRVVFDSRARSEGRDWPSDAETMIGLERLNNLQDCIVHVIQNGVPGDFIETGVWRGGATIFMRGALEVLGDSERAVWVADSFRGLPKPDAETYPVDAGDVTWTKPQLAISLEEVKRNFERYGLLDERVRFLPGWFRDTLPDAPIDRLAIIRLDGDMYESTIVALRALYPKLSPGGFLIVDDGQIETCRLAVEDFRSGHHISEPLQPIDWNGLFWQKQA